MSRLISKEARKLLRDHRLDKYKLIMAILNIRKKYNGKAVIEVGNTAYIIKASTDND